LSSDADGLDGGISPRENTNLVGHHDAAAFLAQAYRSGRIHHAVLIEGPEGIGKATLAFHFAQHVLTHPDAAKAPEPLAVPDPASAVFRQVASGASHDLMHLTRPVDEKTGRVKSAITVDEVRRAGRFLQQTSGTGGWRIVIVDPADDLHRSAANAILKMLEEPPARAMFLVVSHAPGRLLPTIRSRCLTLRLTQLPPDDVVAGLRRLPVGAGLDPAKLERVALRSEGSLRRAIMMLNYGGLDLIDALEKILQAGKDASRREMHVLADTLAAKEREEAYGFFCDYALARLGDMARQSGVQGMTARAARQAEAAERASRDLQTAQAYNLDRKQTMLSLLGVLIEAAQPWP
jgi:DNA polymerase III subunit delta'